MLTSKASREPSFTYNSSTLSGCLDLIVVEHDDKSLRSTNICLKIGKMKLMNVAKKTVRVFINGFQCKHNMLVDGDGLAYFESSLLPKFNRKPNRKTEAPSKNGTLFLDAKDSYSSTKDDWVEHKEVSNPFQLYSGQDKIKGVTRIEISICAHLIRTDHTKLETEHIFEKHKIKHQVFKTHPHQILEDKRLMIRINDRIYDAFFGIPQLLSLNLFQKELSFNNLQEINQRKTANSPNSINRPDVAESNRVSNANLKIPADFFDGVPLLKGKNQLQFLFIGNFGKEYTIDSRLFFFPFQKNFRVIVSDIDGTITRSDLLGHLMPIIGQDWTHDGIAQLFTNLVKRGYVLVYLSARNIGLAGRTKKFLDSIDQEGVKMPDGPVITSPKGLFSALNHEIIEKNPQVFKIKVLRSLYKVFGGGEINPLFAGFGNKETDAISYTTVSIETKRIFTINEKSEIKVLKSGSTVKFTDLNRTIDEAFPVFDPHETFEELPYEVELRNKTVGNVVQQTLCQPLFKGPKTGFVQLQI